MGAEMRGSILHVDGDLTIAVATARRHAFAAALADPGFGGLDLSGVTALDGAGLQLLMLAARHARRVGIMLMATPPSRAVRESLAVARLDADLQPLPRQGGACDPEGGRA